MISATVLAGTRDSVRRLWTMRNIAIGGQLTVIAVTVFAFKIALPLAAIGITIVLLAGFNAFTWLRLRQETPIREIEIVGQFWVDLTALSTLLYFTGGATNPFVSFYLPILAVAAAALQPRYVWFLSVFSVVAYSALGVVYIPLDIHGQLLAIRYHLLGMWVNFVVGAGYIAWFVLRMSKALRDRETALASAQQRLLQDARIVALGAQAARAAHELSTPLSSIAVAMGELHAAVHADASLHAYRADVEVIESELARCEEVLDSLRRPALDTDRDPAATIDAWLPLYASDWRLRHPHARLIEEFQCEAGALCADTVLLGQVLTIILDNAARASEEVTFRVIATSASLEATVEDRGAGVPAALRSKVGLEPVASASGGRGWGLFLARAAVDSRGGALRITERNNGGTTVVLEWPLDAVPVN